jgi:uncharacterized protein
MREGDLGLDDMTVDEAAQALGTTPQTVRALLRRGELRGRQRTWGSRYVWVPSREGVEEFLAAYGRLEGRRRRKATVLPADVHAETAPAETAPAETAPAELAPPEFAPAELAPAEPVPTEAMAPAPQSGRRSDRPFVLRVRGRATVVVVVLGVPMAVAYAGLRVLPDALWFHEVGQAAVYRGVLTARLELYVLVAAVAACFIGANLALAIKPATALPRRARLLTIIGVSFVTGSLFANSAQGHWQTYLLWRHRQSFGVTDPVHGRDVGFFVFTLPLALLVSGVLLLLVVVAGCYVALAYRMQGRLQVSRPGTAFAPLLHLAVLSAFFLLVVAWRFQLDQYRLELGQPSSPDGSVSGAGYVDVYVRYPGLTALTIAAEALAFACLVAPFLVRSGRARRARRLVVVTGLAMAVTVGLVGAAAPALVQRFVVDPSPVLREAPYLASSIAATRHGLGLDSVLVEPYTPTGGFSAADFPALSKRLADVPVWDRWVLEARMRQLVSETPYYSPQDPVLDVTRVDGRRQLTITSARELDVRLVRGQAETWINDRLAYTHGLGLIRFSATQVKTGREPRLLDTGTGVAEPRIYFGQPPRAQATAADEDEGEGGADEGGEGERTGRSSEPATSGLTLSSPWVVANTRRPEVDIPARAPQRVYHYDGTGGIELSSRVRRAAFALALGSKELLLSDDITPESRVLVNRDVRDRLTALSPFIQWDTNAVPLTANGRVIFAVDGYTTSRNYPYAQLVDLGGVPVNYARASVRATVDAFSGRVDVYLVDESEPIARAWAEAFPTIFHPEYEMPAELRKRWRYPADLFAAQATAYERFHTTRPDLFVSEADAWSRPIALSGPVEVAGDVNFDESDEDDLRLTMQPEYTFSRPPGRVGPRLVLSTYYTPQRAQNLVATLSGWIDDNGQARLTARSLPRDEVTLGPAQMSRLVFSTPRVTNLLGLRNLELRDIDKSSLDAVLLGRPHLLFLSQGVAQVQSLYEGSRGPGAARLLGVTAYLDGQAGLGPDIESALRQALNEPPRIEVVTPKDAVAVGRPVKFAFHLENARTATVTITSPAGRHSETVDIASGTARVTWKPTVAGEAVVRVRVDGLDGTRVADRTVLQVLDRPPTVRLARKPIQAMVGERVRIPFHLKHALTATATISTRTGIVFSREYLLHQGTGVVRWTPKRPGTAVLRIKAHGRQGQTATKRVRIIVAPRLEPPRPPAPPSVELLVFPEVATVGEPVKFAFRADDCSAAVARIEGPGETVLTWRFPCPARKAKFAWTPTVPGRYLLTLLARSADTTAKVTTSLTVDSPIEEPST